MERCRAPYWLLPNLLSLDAPLVAVAWMWMLARSLRVEYIHAAAWLVLPISIWCVYASDRILDAWRHPELRISSPRHMFHWKCRWGLLFLVAIGSFYCLWQSLYGLPRTMFSAGLVTLLLCGIYFFIAFFQGKETAYSKNLLAGMIFAMGVGIPVNAANSNLIATDFKDIIYAMEHTGFLDAVWNFGLMSLRTLVVIFLQGREVLLFGLLCTMNIIAIDLWERVEAANYKKTEQSHEITLTVGLIILAGVAFLFAIEYADEYSKPFYYAIMVAAAVLQGINHYRENFSPSAQRVLADFALLVPIPIFLVV